MSFIVETISGDRRIQLANEEIVRPMSMGTSWTKIRIGVRHAVWIVSGNFGATEYAIGVCQGQNGVTSPGTVDAVGMVPGGSITPTWNYTAAGGVIPPVLSPTGSGIQAFTKVGALYTATAGGGNTGALVGNPNTSHSAYYVDILKGSPQYSITLWSPQNAAAAQTEITRSAFLQSMENEAAPANVSSSNAVPFTYAGNGLLDSVFLYWSRFSPTLEISDITVCRFT